MDEVKPRIMYDRIVSYTVLCIYTETQGLIINQFCKHADIAMKLYIIN